MNFHYFPPPIQQPKFGTAISQLEALTNETKFQIKLIPSQGRNVLQTRSLFTRPSKYFAQTSLPQSHRPAAGKAGQSHLIPNRAGPSLSKDQRLKIQAAEQTIKHV